MLNTHPVGNFARVVTSMSEEKRRTKLVDAPDRGRHIYCFPPNLPSLYGEEVYAARLKYLAELANDPLNPDSLALSEIIVWGWLKNSRGRTFKVKDEDIAMLGKQERDERYSIQVWTVFKRCQTIFENEESRN